MWLKEEKENVGKSLGADYEGLKAQGSVPLAGPDARTWPCNCVEAESGSRENWEGPEPVREEEAMTWTREVPEKWG